MIDPVQWSDLTWGLIFAAFLAGCAVAGWILGGLE